MSEERLSPPGREKKREQQREHRRRRLVIASVEPKLTAEQKRQRRLERRRLHRAGAVEATPGAEDWLLSMTDAELDEIERKVRRAVSVEKSEDPGDAG